MKYTAVKLKNLPHWVWFKTENLTTEAGRLVGKTGWGLEGALTDIDVDADLEEGRITSEELQYGE